MNTERLIREVEKRLAKVDDTVREEVLDALREEIARERRRADPSLTVEGERARRVEAETLRNVLEAINRQARLSDTIEEVLKQLASIVTFDSCSLALLEPDGRFRVLACRGFEEPEKIVGVVFQNPLTDEIFVTKRAVAVADAQADARFTRVEGVYPIRSWAGIPLLVESEVIGLLCLDRASVATFEEEDLHRAKAVAFSAAAAIRKARLLDQVRRYAALMERTVAVDQAVFAHRPLAVVAQTILEGALHLGAYPAGVLVLRGDAGPLVAAVTGSPFAGIAASLPGRLAPVELDVESAGRLSAGRGPELGRALGAVFPAEPLYLVPVATPERHVGTLVLVDPNGETSDDRLVEAYASRAATAYLYATQERG